MSGLIPVARALARLVAFALLVALAVVGLAAAIFSIQDGLGGLSLGHLAALIGLPSLRDEVGDFLASLEAPGPTAVIAALAGLGAILVGLLLLLGALASRRERLVTLASDDGGRIVARKRPLAAAASALAEQAPNVVEAKARVRPGRRASGIVRLRAKHTRPADASEVERAVTEELKPLSEPFGLRTRITTRIGEKGSRVQ